ncbi:MULTISPECIES: potassium channel family protein [Streptomyces]|uniref:Membrane protein n=1 Tax=Streptomyces coelicolor (strain ATCC BAA-471 / A3(2) / M145) TaxID=100226 RepID=O86498_STRCO|nr:MULTISPECIES: potassium channel family protein [Streptomyces]MDX2928595.1 ion channel [Streptomyces sp. NRRL_B-16638]MDX3366585.1 ion channel [Streptomyces sp. ME02-6987-2C]MDX3404695.1 ion channel [Streptomyces sp. ME02-6977A]MDX3425555.1 ion channel [Streptomyces sp. ME02-6985-2c]MYU45842.1 two pore domain potassium channel family protein [Streptomyces sp. SID7813]
MSDTNSGGGRQAASGPAPRGRLPFRRRVALVAVARPLIVTVGLVTAYYLLPLDERLSAGTLVSLVCGLLAVLLVFCWEVRAITRSPHPRLRAIEGLAATLVLFLVLFAGSYYLLGRSAPGSFSEPLNRTDALYFTLTTFATVGFGDITARSETGRILTMAQMTGGLLLVGVAARVLASAVQAGLHRQGRGPAASPRSGAAEEPEAGP